MTILGNLIMSANWLQKITVFAVFLLFVMTGVLSASPSDLRLVNAAAGQDLTAIRSLLNEGIDVNQARADGVTALLWATHWDDSEAVELLLTAGADVNASDDHGVTPLIRASENASAEMVDLLIAAGANVDIAQTSGLTPLMVASRTGSVDVVQKLLSEGASVNAATAETSSTALMWAIAAPHREIVALLLAAGADVHGSTTKGMTPLLTAARSGDIELAKLLIQAGADVNDLGSDGTHALPFSIINGRADFVFFLLEEGADPNGSIAGISALHAAVADVDLWLHHWDRRHGAESIVGIFRDGGRRPLTSEERLPVVDALLEHGADPNNRITTTTMIMSYIGFPTKGAFESFACGTGDLRGATPLWVAAFGSNRAYRPDSIELAQTKAAVMKTLLAAGADQHLTTDDGTTPFMAAAGLGRGSFSPGSPRGVRSFGAEEAVKVLLEAGAEINAVNEADFSALHGAAFRGLNEVVQILVENGADIDARDFRGRTPFRLAEGSKQSFQFQAFPETAGLLKELGANVRLGVPGTVQERADRDVAANLQ